MNLFDLMATISLNTSEYEHGISSVQSGASDAKDALSSIGSAGDSAESGLNDVADAAGGAGSDLSSLGSEADSTGSDLDELGSDAESAGEGLSSFTSDLGDVGDELSDLGSEADDAASSLDDLGSDADDAASSLDDLAESADSTASSISDLGDASEGALDGLGEIGTSMAGTVTSGCNEASTAVKSISGVISNLATGNFVGAAVAGVTAIGAGMYNMASASQNASATIAQGTGATGKALEEMTATAKAALADVALASDTNLQDVSATLAELNTRYGLTGDELQETTTKMTDFATITGQNGVSATDAIADVTAKWHMSAEDMPGLLDDITTASQFSGQSAASLESALSANSAAFQQLGYDTEEALSFMSAYSLAGGDASDMTAILKTAVNNLTDEVDDVPGAFQDAIAAIQNADDASAALNAEVGDTGMTVQDVFGTKNANKMISALQSEQYAIEDATAALRDNDGAMEQTAADSVTFSDKISGAWNSLKGACSKAWSSIKGIFTSTSDTSKEAGNGLVKGLKNSESGVESAAEDLGNAVINGVNDTLETHSPSKVMIETGENVSEGLSEGMASLPDKISGTLSSVLGCITDFGSSAVDSMSTSADEAVDAMDSKYSESPSVIGKALDSAFSKIKSWASDSESEASASSASFVDNIKNGLSSLANTVQAPMTEAMSNTSDWGSKMINNAVSTASGFVSSTTENLSSFASKVRDKLDSVNPEVDSWGKKLNDSFGDIGVNVIDGLINGMESMVSSLYSSIKHSLSGLVDKAKDALGIESPSKVFRYQIGEMIGEGLALGITDTEGEVDKAMDNLLAATDVDDLEIPAVSMAAPEVQTVSGSSYGSVEEQIADLNSNFAQLFAILQEYFPQFAAETEIRLDSGELVGATAKKMDRALGQLAAAGGRGR